MPKRTPGSKAQRKLDRVYATKQNERARNKRQRKAAARMFELMSGWNMP